MVIRVMAGLTMSVALPAGLRQPWIMRRFLSALFATSTILACSGATATDLLGDAAADGTTDGTTADGSSSDASAGDVGPDGFPGACTPDGGFPNFQKGCGGNANCIVKLHQIDCCGSMIAIGLNHAEFAAFDTAEQAWEAACPKCKCPPKPTVAEDGNSGPNANVKVSCDNGTCKTTF
jgi:hypothetical protein